MTPKQYWDNWTQENQLAIDSHWTANRDAIKIVEVLLGPVFAAAIGEKPKADGFEQRGTPFPLLPPPASHAGSRGRGAGRTASTLVEARLRPITGSLGVSRLASF